MGLPVRYKFKPELQSVQSWDRQTISICTVCPKRMRRRREGEEGRSGEMLAKSVNKNRLLLRQDWEGRGEEKNRRDVSQQTDRVLMMRRLRLACRVIKQKGEHQQRTLLQMSPVALESEADMILLPALSSPPLHRKGGTLLLSARGYRGVGGERERGRRAQPKCFTADVAALPQQPFPIQNWCPYCSTGVYTPAYWYSGFLHL